MCRDPKIGSRVWVLNETDYELGTIIGKQDVAYLIKLDDPDPDDEYNGEVWLYRDNFELVVSEK